MIKIYKHKIAMILVIIGAINWGLTALNFNIIRILTNYINNFLKFNTNLDKMIYLIVAVSGIYLIKRDTFLPFLGKTVIPPSVIPFKNNIYSEYVTEIKVKPNTKVIYWASRKLDSDNHIVWKAYDNYSNSGVVMSDINGIATIKLEKGSGYVVPWKNKKIPPHFHYRYEIKPGKLSRIETVYY